MHVSAVERTPPELWLNILGIATRSPQLPYPDDTMLQAMSLFLTDCKQDRISRDWTRAVTSYRLVCRSWQAAIEALVPFIVQCSVDKLLLIPCPKHILRYSFNPDITRAHRLETWAPHECYCSPRRSCRSSQSASELKYIQGLRCQQIEPSGDYVDEYHNVRSHLTFLIYVGPTSNFSRLSIFIASNYMPPNSPVALLEKMPALKALVWGDDWSAFYFDSVLRHEINQRLTHLQLRFAWEDLYTLQHPAHFPELHHLFLDIDHHERPVEKVSDLNLSTWATFPALRSLCLEAEVGSGQNDNVLAFLAKCGATLSSLRVKISIEYIPIPFEITPETWESFPRLAEFGPGLHTLVMKPTPPPTPITLLFSFSERYGYPPDATAMVTWRDALASFVDGCRQWQTKVARMVETWEEIDALLGRNPRLYDGVYDLPNHVEFYRLLLENNIEVHDRNGFSSESSIAAAVLSKL